MAAAEWGLVAVAADDGVRGPRTAVAEVAPQQPALALDRGVGMAGTGTDPDADLGMRLVSDPDMNPGLAAQPRPAGVPEGAAAARPDPAGVPEGAVAAAAGDLAGTTVGAGVAVAAGLFRAAEIAGTARGVAEAAAGPTGSTAVGRGAGAAAGPRGSAAAGEASGALPGTAAGEAGEPAGSADGAASWTHSAAAGRAAGPPCMAVGAAAEQAGCVWVAWSSGHPGTRTQGDRPGWLVVSEATANASCIRVGSAAELQPLPPIPAPTDATCMLLLQPPAQAGAPVPVCVAFGAWRWLPGGVSSRLSRGGGHVSFIQ